MLIGVSAHRARSPSSKQGSRSHTHTHTHTHRHTHTHTHNHRPPPVRLLHHSGTGASTASSHKVTRYLGLSSLFLQQINHHFPHTPQPKCVFMSACVCVCVCVCEGERDRVWWSFFLWWCVCVCVCGGRGL